MRLLLVAAMLINNRHECCIYHPCQCRCRRDALTDTLHTIVFKTLSRH